MSADKALKWAQKLLGSQWSVDVQAALGGDQVLVSALLVAQGPNGIETTVTIDRGTANVMVRNAGADPVPFEDLAVAMGVLELDTLLDRVRDEKPQEEVGEPVIGVREALECVSMWGPELATTLSQPETAQHLRYIADQVAKATGFFNEPPAHPPPEDTASYGLGG